MPAEKFLSAGGSARTLPFVSPSFPGTTRLSAVLLFLLAAFPASGEEASRKWTDLSGRSFEGALVSATPAAVKIRRADGKVFEVTREKLSKEDNDYLATAKPAGEEPKPAPAPLPGHLARFGGMLAGYDGKGPNFDAPWPGETGIDQEPAITVIEENAESRRYVYESPHFRFESNVVLRPSLLSKVAMMFEACFQTHHDVPLNNRRTRSPQAPKLKARLFETMAEYQAAGGPQGSAGVYMGGPDEFLVPLEKLGVKKVGSGYMFDYAGDFHTMYHEVTHQLWADLGDYAGIWMIEGFAEFMATAPYRNGRFSFSRQPKFALEYATGYGKKEQGGRALGENITMPKLEKLLTMSQATFYENGNANYGYGLLLVYYFILLDGKGDGALFRDCIRGIQEGKSQPEALKVLMAGRSYEDLEKEVATAFRKKGIKISFGG